MLCIQQPDVTGENSYLRHSKLVPSTSHMIHSRKSESLIYISAFRGEETSILRRPDVRAYLTLSMRRGCSVFQTIGHHLGPVLKLFACVSPLRLPEKANQGR
jgi:hypothetical protein